MVWRAVCRDDAATRHVAELAMHYIAIHVLANYLTICWYNLLEIALAIILLFAFARGKLSC